MSRFVLFTLLFWAILFCTIVHSEQAPIRYAVSAADTTGHYFQVEMIFNVKSPEMVNVKMPVWIPGSYLVREFERHVLDFHALDADGNSLPWKKINKNTWQIDPKNAKQLRVRYRVYAFDTSIRASFLNANRAFVNPSSVCMFLQGRLNVPHHIQFQFPSNWNKISTGLERVDKADHVFRAENYDELVDCPIEIGNQKIVRFSVDGILYEISVTGTGNVDADTLVPYFKKIIRATTSLMPAIPYERYVFLMQLRQHGGGGLEHRNSCVLQSSRWSFQPYSRFRGFLGLVAHEFFHAWNVKAIRPYPLGPFDYDSENYTYLLWVAEGFTTYYGSRILRKADLITEEKYLSSIGNRISRYVKKPGRKWQSLSEASFDAWIKYYRSNENSYNTIISYYSKGALVGMLLDLMIRHETNNQRSLDDVMQTLYRRFYVQKDKSFRTEDIRRICEKISGKSLTSFFDKYVDGTEKINFDRYLRYAGLHLVADSSENDDDIDFGIRWRERNEKVFISRVVANSSAYEAGLNVYDELLAIDQFCVSPSNFDKILSAVDREKPHQLTVSRNGLIHHLQIKFPEKPKPAYHVERMDGPNSLQEKVYHSWIYSQD